MESIISISAEYALRAGLSLHISQLGSSHIVSFKEGSQGKDVVQGYVDAIVSLLNQAIMYSTGSENVRVQELVKEIGRLGQVGTSLLDVKFGAQLSCCPINFVLIPCVGQLSLMPSLGHENA